MSAKNKLLKRSEPNHLQEDSDISEFSNKQIDSPVGSEVTSEKEKRKAHLDYIKNKKRLRKRYFKND